MPKNLLKAVHDLVITSELFEVFLSQGEDFHVVSTGIGTENKVALELPAVGFLPNRNERLNRGRIPIKRERAVFLGLFNLLWIIENGNHLSVIRDSTVSKI